MALQNIGAGNRDDAFYRYKMPRMITKIEGRGNGIKTNVVNMVDIAKALARPPSYTTKYFGCELGAQSKFDEKTGISLVNGAHDTAKLAGLLENFIKKYVQCYGCGNPETEILITKSQMVQLKCAACGFISDVDMRDKLTSFILKNPPESKKNSKDKKSLRRAEKERLKEGEAADEELKKAKKDAKKKVTSKDAPTVKTSSKKKTLGGDGNLASPPRNHINEDEDDNDEDDDDDVTWQTDTSMEAARQRIQEQLNAVTADMVMLSTNDDDTSKKSKKVNKTEESLKPASSPPSNEAEKNETSSHEKLVDELKENMKQGISTSQFLSVLGSLSGTPQEIMTALYESLLDGVDKGYAKVIVKKKNYLAAAMSQNEGSQVYLLNAIGEFCGKTNSAPVKEVALVLKALYDADILEEEYIVEWYNGGVKEYNDSPLWKNAKPFVDWLQSAESETEEE
ncbi:unnamed protein product [Cuscuta epithymum]|uniref:W2 domain-containing protein n=1 Tax=Cuscuta epithymum TaxID=186058 RepID=A0AAV0F3N0_9ASTE|nr:unnamed protein product [Cuscuta epithymum]